MSAGTKVDRVARKAEQSPVVKGLARTGFVATGIIHLLLGVLAIQVAIGGRQQESDQTGALDSIAKAPFGMIVLWVLAIGLAGLTLWFVVEAILGEGTEEKVWARRLSAVGKAIPYGALSLTAFRFALGSGSSASSSTQGASSKILALPGGQILLGIVGLAVLAIGAYFVYRGATRGFLKNITVKDQHMQRPITVLGIVGYVAKGIAIGVVGILVVVAAFTLNPQQSSGLDGALKALAGLPFGIAILVAVGIGLIAYGVYSVARARYAKV